jgi:CheY-like chemotaxis protein
MAAGPRPTVLLVDDHRQILDSVSAILADDFDVAGVATDGTEAVDLARRIRPDVVVLDVEMPGLNGFETVRALNDAGLSATPAVFLSMHDADEIVSEAFRCGGRGYVLKRRVRRDLARAIGQALSGRYFGPSLTSLSELCNGRGHVTQLHGDMESFLDDVAELFDRALRCGDATCVVASAPVREGLGNRLRAHGWKIGGSSGCTRYRAVDAADALDQCMRKDLPDAHRLAATVAELDQYRQTAADPSSRLILFGTMAVSLCEDGNAEAVLALERLWDTLTSDLPIFTVCAYAAPCFDCHEPDIWRRVCAEHSALTHAGDV